ncbi:hypothetical protein PVAND_004661 [Polypedilum vanderplanki]|uniref:Uncharacterized protein n=1 Tax=Polypedilum vanderplanki TaxID=319348 RepID=A0A9J6BYS5_POLVA|nr:hypothetical protein PVAND_004661 [Polypedilum vanderplanki]
MIRLLSLIFIFFFTNSFADDIFIGPCSLNAENRDDCLRFKVNKLIELTPRMRDKNDEFPTDNLEMKDIQSDIGNGNISILSLKFEECMSFKVLNFRTEFDKDQKIITAYLGFNVQLLKILSTLDVDFHFIGEMSQFRDLKTKGKAQAIFENVNADMIIKTDVITENDFSFLSLVDLKGNLNCPSLKLFDFNFLSEPKNRFHNVAMNTLIKEYFYKLCDIFVNNYSPEKSRNIFYKKLQEKLEFFEVIE